MTMIDGTTNFPHLLEDCENETVFPTEFMPTGCCCNNCNDECEYDTPIFYDFADDLMETEFFEREFGDDYFAIYVLRGCSMSGDIEWYDEANYIPMIYTRLVENTPENRYRFYGPDAEYSASDDYSTEEEESLDDSNGDSDCSYDPEWEA